MPVTLIRPRILYAWRGPSFVIVDMRGECGDGEPLSGYYFREARFLRTLQLRIDGEEPWLCEAASVAPALLTFVYTYPEVAEYGGGGSGQSGDETPHNGKGIPQRALSIDATIALHAHGMNVSVAIANHADRAVTFELEWRLGADFADIQEAQASARQQEARVDARATGNRVSFAYAHEQLHYQSLVHVDGEQGWRATAGSIGRTFTLERGESAQHTLRVGPSEADGSALPGDATEREQTANSWRDRFARFSAPGDREGEAIVADNVRDVASFPLLEGRPDEWLALQAGMPLYPALFGRDTLTAGWQAAWLDRGESLDASLTRLGRLQSSRRYDWRDEEPGRIPYQIRQGPLARLDRNPYSAYYADFASPLMFVIALGHAYFWSGETALIRRHWDAARRILEWARTDGDKDRDGYLEYQTRSSKGTKNQGWKDSGDAIIYEDGRPVPPPLGTCELQGYWFAAQQLMAVLSWALGSRGDARAHWRSAMSLKRRFNRDWWIDDESTIALALDPQKRKVAAVSSNIGHCITSGIVDDDHLPIAVPRLMAPDMFSGWGIRTLSTRHIAYNPLSYHCGSVWAVEQATIVFGLRRFGFDAEALQLTRALFDLAKLYPAHRIPETVGGYARGDRATPGAYPQANTPQLWNASAFPLLVHTMLGLQPVAPLHLLVVTPDLPEWMPEAVLHDLRLGESTATIRFWRGEHGHSHAEIVKSTGTFRLLVQPPPESLTAGVRDRVRGLFETIRR
jgi:glycogen debranching enzyme